jgi:hypothetical protein
MKKIFFVLIENVARAYDKILQFLKVLELQIGARKWAMKATEASFEFKVCKSTHHHSIPINQPTRCNNVPGLLLDDYVRLNMFRASSRPSSGAQQLQYQHLVLPLDRGGSSAVSRSRAGRPDHDQTVTTTTQR